jgi:hypothetical protein
LARKHPSSCGVFVGSRSRTGDLAHLLGLVAQGAHAITQAGDQFRFDLGASSISSNCSVIERWSSFLNSSPSCTLAGGQFGVHQAPIGILMWWFECREEEDDGLGTEADDQEKAGERPVLDLEQEHQ